MTGKALKLKDLDRNIIRELLRDGRKGFAEIAQENGATKNQVWKRYKILEKKGVIRGATTQINYAHFGYEAVATFLISVDAQHIESVMQQMKRITEVLAYRQYNSVYNVRAFATLKDLNELDYVKQEIRRKLPTMGLRTYLWTDIRNRPENLSLTDGKKDSFIYREEKDPTIHEQNESPKIDDLDYEISERLAVDGRASFTQIAKEIGTSTDTVMKRYHKLERKGAMKAKIQIDPKKIGYKAILDIDIAFASVETITGDAVDLLTKIPDVIIITKTSGDYDLQLTAMIRDIEESFAIQDQIAKTVKVTKMDVSARKIPDQWPTPKQYISTF